MGSGEKPDSGQRFCGISTSGLIVTHPRRSAHTEDSVLRPAVQRPTQRISRRGRVNRPKLRPRGCGPGRGSSAKFLIYNQPTTGRILKTRDFFPRGKENLPKTPGPKLTPRGSLPSAHDHPSRASPRMELRFTRPLGGVCRNITGQRSGGAPEI
jgi:hypothetical protein